MQEDWTFVERLSRKEQEQRCSAATGADTKEIHTKGCSWEHQKYDKGRTSRVDGLDDGQQRGFLIPGTASMSATLAISISNVIVAEINRNAIYLPIKIESKRNKEKIIEMKALLDTGAGGKFIDQNFVLANGIRTHALETPITVYNVDGMKNKTGTITQYVDLNL